jgi:hypothetical protein
MVQIRLCRQRPLAGVAYYLGQVYQDHHLLGCVRGLTALEVSQRAEELLAKDPAV